MILNLSRSLVTIIMYLVSWLMDLKGQWLHINILSEFAANYIVFDVIHPGEVLRTSKVFYNNGNQCLTF